MLTEIHLPAYNGSHEKQPSVEIIKRSVGSAKNVDDQVDIGSPWERVRPACQEASRREPWGLDIFNHGLLINLVTMGIVFTARFVFVS